MFFVTSKLRMELRGATEIELLDRFGCVQTPDRKRTMGKDAKGGTSLRPVTPNEPGIERRTR